MDDIVLIGFGGHAKSVADSIERSGKFRIVGYTDLCEVDSKYKYLGTDDELPRIFFSGIHYAAIGVGYLGKGYIREKLYTNAKKIGFNFPTIIDPTSVISEYSRVGEGTFIGKNTIVNAEAIVGKMCILNTGAIIEHECQLGDFVHVAVGAILCGKVKVGSGALIGANATVIQCKIVSDYQIVPAGQVIR